ncbi:MAG: hypothetical protein ACOYLQ_17885 [Hyphomicrobiaceae bacterium]
MDHSPSKSAARISEMIAEQCARASRGDPEAAVAVLSEVLRQMRAWVDVDYGPDAFQRVIRAAMDGGAPEA